MDKSVIFAVAGSGKTTHLVARLDEEKRFLIVTYTNSNYENLRNKIIKRFGYFPPNITLYTYFKFLYGFCFRPFLSSKLRTKGVSFDSPPQFPLRKLTDLRRYMTSDRRLYSNRIAKLIEYATLNDAVVLRLEKYFDVFLVDEVQDFAGHDFNFLSTLSTAKIDITFVGDFFQHTFDTSRDGSVNKNLHQDYDAYKARFKTARVKVDTDSLKNSYRCSKNVCDFITKKIGIKIESSHDHETLVNYVDDPTAVRALYDDPSVVKLFLQGHYKYSCFSQNWGASKGLDHYNDVCVVLNPANVKAWKNGSFRDINVETRNKLYVACSRARGNLTFIPEALLKPYIRALN